jgi:hypothetical protein
MQKGFLSVTLGGRKIEHLPCPNPNVAIDMSKPPAGVLHTIEGGIDAGLAVFQHHFAPHFALDGQRIVQLVPLGMLACALENRPGGVETNSVVRAQIEVAGKSQESPWVPDGPEFESLADLLATLSKVADIPLERPFSDKLPPPPWATTSFARRTSGKFGTTPGWFGHIEVPENEHWDPGQLEWSKLITRAEQIVAEANGRHISSGKVKSNKAPKELPDWYWTWLNWRLGEGDFKAFGPHDAGHRPDLPFGGPGQDPIPTWAWEKASTFVGSRQGAHP